MRTITWYVQHLLILFQTLYYLWVGQIFAQICIIYSQFVALRCLKWKKETVCIDNAVFRRTKTIGQLYLHRCSRMNLTFCDCTIAILAILRFLFLSSNTNFYLCPKYIQMFYFSLIALISRYSWLARNWFIARVQLLILWSPATRDCLLCYFRLCNFEKGESNGKISIYLNFYVIIGALVSAKAKYVRVNFLRDSLFPLWLVQPMS